MIKKLQDSLKINLENELCGREFGLMRIVHFLEQFQEHFEGKTFAYHQLM